MNGFFQALRNVQEAIRKRIRRNGPVIKYKGSTRHQGALRRIRISLATAAGAKLPEGCKEIFLPEKWPEELACMMSDDLVRIRCRLPRHKKRVNRRYGYEPHLQHRAEV